MGSNSKPKVVCSVEFEMSHDLLITAVKKEKNVIDAIAISGGIYIILCAVIGFVFSSLVPYFMHLYIIRNLFKMDNNAGKKP